VIKHAGVVELPRTVELPPRTVDETLSSCLKEARVTAGDVLDLNNLPGTSNLLGKIAGLLGKKVDIKPGMDYAVEQGWFEKLPGDKYRLTDAGFAAAS
jgi:hypothetical protein